MKKINKLVPFILMVTLLSACGSSAESGVTLLVWEDESNIETLKTLADEFVAYHKQTYPSEAAITITFESREEGKAVSDLSTIAETGKGPDVVSITSDTMTAAVKSKLIAPAAFSADVDTFDAKARTNATYDDTVYAYPITAESTVIMYDKRQVSDPTIFDSFAALKNSGKKIAWDASNDDCAYYMFGFLTDSVVFGDDGTDASKLDLATTQSVANLTSFLNDYSSSIESASPQDAMALINNKTVVGLVSSPFMLSSMIENLGAANVGLHVLPTINDVAMRPFSGYKEYVVSSYSKHPSLAQEFADYMVSPDAQLWRLTKKNYLPTRSSDDLTKEIADNPYASVYQASYDKSFAMPIIDSMGKYWSSMITALQLLWANKGTVTSSEVKSQLTDVQTAMKAA